MRQRRAAFPPAPRLSAGQTVAELLAELGDLGRDDELAIALLGMQGEIIAVIVLGRPESGRLAQLRDQRGVVDFLRLDFSHDVLRLLALRLVLPEDGGFVLGPDVVALAARRGG